MPFDRDGIIHWCDSVEETFHPRELSDIPRGEKPRMISEAFLATAIRYLRGACEPPIMQVVEPPYKEKDDV